MFKTTFSLNTNSGTYTYVNVARKIRMRPYKYLLLQLHADIPDPSSDPADKNQERWVLRSAYKVNTTTEP